MLTRTALAVCALSAAAQAQIVSQERGAGTSAVFLDAVFGEDVVTDSDSDSTLAPGLFDTALESNAAGFGSVAYSDAEQTSTIDVLAGTFTAQGAAAAGLYVQGTADSDAASGMAFHFVLAETGSVALAGTLQGTQEYDGLSGQDRPGTATAELRIDEVGGTTVFLRLAAVGELASLAGEVVVLPAGSYRLSVVADAADATNGVEQINGSMAAAYYDVAGSLVGGVAGTSFCDDGDSALAACPCAAGYPASGCDTAQATGGVLAAVAEQDTSGLAATIVATGFPPAATPTAIVLRAETLEPSPVPFGDGVRCIGLAGFARLAATAASGGTSSHAFGHGAGAGTYHYQVWFRNTPASYCVTTGPGGGAFNLSNGRSLTW